jgi:hypothetical protein
MASRFVQQATKQVDPIYTQQIKQAQGQIPSIQKLYDSLGASLTAQNNQQLATGVQSIMEDASRRGVLRSTLPVDTRTQLQGELGAALTQGLANIGLQRGQAVQGIYDRVGQLQTNRLSAITGMADTLQQADLRERDFQRQLQADRAARASSGQQSTALNRIYSLLQQAKNVSNDPEATDEERYQAWLLQETAKENRYIKNLPKQGLTLLSQPGGATVRGAGNLPKTVNKVTGKTRLPSYAGL